MITALSRKRASSLALAIALATGSAVVATAVMPAEANAQRTRDRDRGQANGEYSPEFLGAYSPLQEAVNDQSSDLSALAPQLYQLGGMLNTNDEKYAGGSMIFNAATRIQDRRLQLMGMEAMLESGKVPIENTAQYNFIAYQLSNAQEDYPKARGYLQTAIGYNFTGNGFTAPVLQMLMAENHFATQEYADGITYLKAGIAQQKAAAQPVDESWYKRGFAIAYNNQFQDHALDLALGWVGDYPSEAAWRDTINTVRNYNDFQGGELLDLLRLSRLVNTLQGADYDYYVETADARRLPNEVNDVIAEGRAAGEITSDNLFIEEQSGVAQDRVGADRASLPELEVDAMAADASVNLVAAAGDAFLSYSDYAKAATFYERALGMPGVEANEELTRLGIAQVGLGEYDAARETFGKVTGGRAMIARLWLAYIEEQDADDTPSLQDLFS